MALWDKLRTELDRAGRAAQTAIDDGKVRIDLMRVRQLADKTAEALGYAVFRARQEGRELDADSYSRLSATLAAHMAEVERLEGQLARAAEAGTDGSDATEGPAPEASTAGSGAADGVPPAAAAHPPEKVSSVDPAMGDSADRTTP